MAAQEPSTAGSNSSTGPAHAIRPGGHEHGTPPPVLGRSSAWKQAGQGLSGSTHSLEQGDLAPATMPGATTTQNSLARRGAGVPASQDAPGKGRPGQPGQPAGTKAAVAATAGTAAGVQVATPLLMLMKLLSMAQAAVATAASWLVGAFAAVQALGTATVAAVTAAAVGIVSVMTFGLVVLNSPVDEGVGAYCGLRVDVRAALGFQEDAEADVTMVATAQQVWAVMSRWGMPEENIAGILGNWEAESDMEPAVVQGWKPLSEAVHPNNGIGLGQWTGSRNTLLRSYAEAKGADWFTLETQLAFMVEGDEQMYVDIVKHLVATPMGTPDAASRYYRAQWERNKAGTASDPGRAARAEKWYGLMQGWGEPDHHLTANLAELAANMGLLDDALDAIDSVVNTIGGWLGLTCPGALGGPRAPGAVPTWNGGVPPAFQNEPGGRTQAVAVRGARVAHLYFAEHISSYGGQSDRGAECSYSDHCLGLAIDFMVKDWDTAPGNSNGWLLARFFQEHAAALEVTYIIWNKQKWSVSSDAPDLTPSRWRVYNTPRGISNPTNDHYDHVHVSFRAGGE